MAKTSVECRINSVADAKSVVRKQKAILQTMKENNKDSIEFLVATEIQAEVNAVIRGVFRVPTYTSYVSPRPGNVLFKLPHYAEKPVEIPIRQSTMKVEQVPVASYDGIRTLTKIEGSFGDTTNSYKAVSEPKKHKGRKPGSKNKPKPVEAIQ